MSIDLERLWVQFPKERFDNFTEGEIKAIVIEFLNIELQKHISIKPVISKHGELKYEASIKVAKIS